MAKLNFKMGLQARMLETSPVIAPGTIYVTADERAMYIDIPANVVEGKGAHRIRLGDFRVCATFAELQAQAADWTSSCLYYVVDKNALAYYDGSKWTLINDTEELASDIEGLTSSINGVIDRLDGLGTDKGSVKKYIDDADKVISDKIGAIAADATVASEIARLGGEIDAVEGRMDNAEKDIDDLQQEVEAIGSILGGAGSGSITETIDGRIDSKINELSDSKTGSSTDITVKVSTAKGNVSEVVVTENLEGKYATIANLNALKTTLEGEDETLQTAINTLRSDLEGTDATLRADIDANAAKLAGLPTDKTVKQYVDGKATTLESNLKTYADNKVTQELAPITSELEAVGTSITTLTDKDTELENSIIALNTKVAVTGYDSVQAYIDAKDSATLQSAKTYTNDEVKKLADGAVATNAGAIEGLRSAVNTNTGDIEGLKTKANGYDTKLAGITTSVMDEVGKAKTYAEQQANAVDAKVTVLNATVEANSGLIEGLDSAIKKEAKDRADADTLLDQDITALENRLNGIGAGNGAVKKYIDDQDAATLQSAKDYADGKISEVNSANEGLASDLATEIARAKAAEEANAAAAKKANDALGDITNVATSIATAANTAESNAKSEAASELAKAKGELNSAIEGVNTAVNTEKSRAEGVEAGLRTDVDKANTALGSITNVQNAINTAKQAAIDSANQTTQGKLDALLSSTGQVGKNKADIEALTSNHNKLAETVAGHTTELANIKNDVEEEGVVLDSFADVRAYVKSRIAASDAMVFRGTVGVGGTVTSANTTMNSTTKMPANAQAGDTYKVTHTDGKTIQTFAGNSCSVGDLLIALVDNPTTNAQWAYVPSGGEDDTDPSLSLNGTTIELKSDADVELGKVAIVADTDTAARVTGSGSTITVSLEWGTF